MDSTTRHSLLPTGPIISLTVAMLSLGLTSLVNYKQTTNHILNNRNPFSSSSTSENSNVQIFDFNLPSALSTIPSLKMTENARTNRTLWETISSADFHAGLQKVEPDAWIPSHNHETEEIMIIISGQGKVYDDVGIPFVVTPGSMIHFNRERFHTIHNIKSDQPLLLMWCFPTRYGINKFQFQQDYDV